MTVPQGVQDALVALVGALVSWFGIWVKGRLRK